MTDRTHRDLTAADLARIARGDHAWRGEPEAGDDADVPGSCKSATLQQIAEHEYVLTPARYVGAEDVEDDGEPLADKMGRLVAKPAEPFAGERSWKQQSGPTSGG